LHVGKASKDGVSIEDLNLEIGPEKPADSE
jgi:hypothetical protein